MELFVAVPEGTAPRDVTVDVKPRRIRVTARGATLLEGPLGGEVLAANGAGDWEWELGDADGDAEAGKQVAITLNKKCVATRCDRHCRVARLRCALTRRFRAPVQGREL